MEEEKRKDKPFTSYQYEWINGHLVQREDFTKSMEILEQKIQNIYTMSEGNTRNLKIILSVLKWLGGVSGVLVVSQLFNLLFDLMK